MIEEAATVVEVEPALIVVQTLRKSSCNSCAANKACGTAVLSKSIGQKHSLVSIAKAESDEPLLAVGDEVVIGINENMLLSGSVLAYLLPLFGMLGFALLADWMGTQLSLQGELHTVLAGVTGLLAGLYMASFYLTKSRHQSDFVPLLLRKQSAGIVNHESA